jgi:hypothetical protein
VKPLEHCITVVHVTQNEICLKRRSYEWSSCMFRKSVEIFFTCNKNYDKENGKTALTAFLSWDSPRKCPVL